VLLWPPTAAFTAFACLAGGASLFFRPLLVPSHSKLILLENVPTIEFMMIQQ
jgi:hypothetical protein